MARVRILASFFVTLGLLGLVVAVPLWNTGAQAQSAPPGTTLVSYLPVASLATKELAAVHVSNLGSPSAPIERFSIMFVDAAGNLLVPEQICEVASGATCTATLPSQNCPVAGRGGVCRFRAVVVGDPVSCVTGLPPATGAGDWQANLEVLGAGSVSKYVAGGGAVLTLPTASVCAPGTDAPSPDAPPVDAAPSPDAPPVDAAPSPDAPSIDS